MPKTNSAAKQDEKPLTARQKARLEKQKLAREKTEVSIRYIFSSDDEKWTSGLHDEEVARQLDDEHESRRRRLDKKN